MGRKRLFLLFPRSRCKRSGPATPPRLGTNRETLRLCDLFFQWPDHRGSSNLAECGSRVGHGGETGFGLKFPLHFWICFATRCLVPAFFGICESFAAVTEPALVDDIGEYPGLDPQRNPTRSQVYSFRVTSRHHAVRSW